MYSVQCTVCNVHNHSVCTLYRHVDIKTKQPCTDDKKCIILYKMYSVQCTEYDVECIMYTITLYVQTRRYVQTMWNKW